MKEKIKEMLMEQMRMLHEQAKERKDAETLSYLTGAMCEIARTINVMDERSGPAGGHTP